jgi:hypothetical protein
MVPTMLWHMVPSKRVAAYRRSAVSIPPRKIRMVSPGARGQRRRRLLFAAVLALSLTVLSLTPGAGMAAPAQNITFAMTAAQANCLQYATGRVTISSLGPVENMHVEVNGLPPNTDFDFFVIQVPKAPFGLAWYQGDIETDDHGNGVGDFTGRFNQETFIVALGAAPAPVLHHSPIPDAETNPPTGPVHTFHLGLWFNSPHDAVQAGCPGTVTPFNGEHNAGVQVLNTSNYPDDQGPLRHLVP